MAQELEPDEPRAFSEHLGELRNRLLIWVGFLVVFCLIALVFFKDLEAIVVAPLSSNLYYSSPSGGIDFIVKLVIAFGLVPSLPILIYELLQFLRPALPEKLQKTLPRVIFASICLMLFSIIFAFTVGIPIILRFFDTFTSSDIKPLITSTEYSSFIIDYLITAAILFQLPLILTVINKITPIHVRTLNRYQPYIIVGLFLLSGMITPTFEPVSQLVMTLPLVIIFELSVFLVYRVNKPAEKQALADLPQLEARAIKDYEDGQYAQAETAFQKMIQLQPKNPSHLSWLGKIYFKTDRLELALKTFKQAIKKDHTVAAYWANEGNTYMKLSNYRSAAYSFEHAVQLQPENVKYQKLFKHAEGLRKS